jgi:hypothetical protein
MWDSRLILSDFSKMMTYADIVDFSNERCLVYIPDYSTYINLVKDSANSWTVQQSGAFYNPYWIKEIIHYISMFSK